MAEQTAEREDATKGNRNTEVINTHEVTRGVDTHMTAEPNWENKTREVKSKTRHWDSRNKTQAKLKSWWKAKPQNINVKEQTRKLCNKWNTKLKTNNSQGRVGDHDSFLVCVLIYSVYSSDDLLVELDFLYLYIYVEKHCACRFSPWLMSY